MVRVVFTQNLLRHVEAPPATVEAATVREALDRVFADRDRLRGYVLDERGAVRPHMVIFVNGTQIRDRSTLSDAVPEEGAIDVMQALSGG